ncbi:maltotransferase domain-containing protein [Roseixanthobacter glucoisosaccharinicivorans]|uniref:maltotransferase domain-containing protein n=1 Tax=Roseixanthobacter glucoisosaccharinicivorans TaxID=3119923 RepID=UPI0037298A94
MLIISEPRATPQSSVSGRPTPRLYFLEPMQQAAFAQACAHASALGFDTILLASPFATGRDKSVFLSADHDQLNARFERPGDALDAVAALVDEARQHGLDLFLDLVVDRMAPDGLLPAMEPDWFQPREAAPPAPDPRRAPAREGAQVNFADAGVAGAVAAYFADLAGALVDCGVAGFRCDAPQRVPASVWRTIISAGRETAPEARFFAWTPGLTYAQIEALLPAGFDGGFSSLAWWDVRKPWLAQEMAMLNRLGPVIAFPEAPFAARLPARPDAGDPARAHRRALALAAALGDGLLMPAGFEFGARDPLDPTGAVPTDFAQLRDIAAFDLSPAIVQANEDMAQRASDGASGPWRLISPPAAPLAVLIRACADGHAADLVLANASLEREGQASGAALMPRTDGFARFEGPDATVFDTTSSLAVPPGAVMRLHGQRPQPVLLEEQGRKGALSAARAQRLAIEAVSPAVDDGAFPVRRVVGERISVEADVVSDGHDAIAVALLWRPADDGAWREVRMAPLGNDRFGAEFPLERLGRHLFTIEAWRDPYASFHHGFEAKVKAGQDVALEIEEGRMLIAGASATGEAGARIAELGLAMARADAAGARDLLLSDQTQEILAGSDVRPFAVRHPRLFPVDAERERAAFAAWYEIFPRSTSGEPTRHGTFDDVIADLPRIRDLGFDVLYFPPIHPIGAKNRKGRDNTLTPGPDDPGSPYAIGSHEGGHDAVHPQLGTAADFRRMLAAAKDHGLEIALDFAIQCAPDHPWLAAHPGWFDWRPDGSIKYAENPPKKYQDIINVDFFAKDAVPDLWLALRDVVLHWIDQGVRLFRVDNPHTKPFNFWEWLIGDIRARHPDAVFLAEAFTRPKIMHRLAKIGFSQSYTYFTWRNTKAELVQYMNELTEPPVSDFYRPHFFVNTPDINPYYLQTSGRPGFLARAALAATLSGLWGMFSGFELCEADPVPGKEEYKSSDKYEIRARNYGLEGGISAEITLLNRVRRENPALRTHLGLLFLNAWNDQVLAFAKFTPDRDNLLVILVNLDPHAAQGCDFEIPLWELGLPDHATIHVENLIHDQSFSWSGKIQHQHLDPALPFAIYRLSGEA